MKEMKMSDLKNRIENLEKSLRPHPIDWGKIYDALREIDRLMEEPPGVDFEKEFVKRNGTREEFILSQQKRKEDKDRGI